MQGLSKILAVMVFTANIFVTDFVRCEQAYRPLVLMPQMVDSVINEHVDLMAKNDLGDTLLHRWAMYLDVGKYEFEDVERVLSATPLPSDMKKLQNINGNTPLHIVCRKNFLNASKFKVFVKWGIPLNIQNIWGQTILHCLAQSGSGYAKQKSEILHYLKKWDLSEVINLRDEQGRTAIHLAIQNDDKMVFDFLINFRELNCNAKDNNLNTPLHYAAISFGKNHKNARLFIYNLLRVRAYVYNENIDGKRAYKFIPKKDGHIRNRLKY